MVVIRVVLMLALLVYQLSHCLVYHDAKGTQSRHNHMPLMISSSRRAQLTFDYQGRSEFR